MIALYRLLDEADVHLWALRQPRFEQTRGQMEAKLQVVLVQGTTELDFTQYPKSTSLTTDWRSSGARSAFANRLGSRPYNAGGSGMRASGAIGPPSWHSRGIAQRRRRGKETEEWSCCIQTRGPPGSSKQFVHVADPSPQAKPKRAPL